jgi:predicted transcriptional regulator
MTDTRTRIRSTIESNPGIHFRGLVRELDLATGQVQYHLRRLRKTAVVDEHEYNGQTHYFAGEYGEWERNAIALLRRETPSAIVVTMYASDPVRPPELADRLDLPRSTLEHHLGTLEDADLIERQRNDADQVVVELTRPSATASLVEVVDVDPGERLVDRFQRLVDSLLEGS